MFNNTSVCCQAHRKSVQVEAVIMKGKQYLYKVLECVLPLLCKDIAKLYFFVKALLVAHRTVWAAFKENLSVPKLEK
jgi:hypothetical protein